MKKFILSTIVVVSFGLYVLLQGTGNASSDLSLPAPAIVDNNPKNPKNTDSNTPTQTNPVINNPSPTPTPTPKPVIPTPTKTGMYKDGEYTGGNIDAYYGYVQVKAIISGGKLTNIAFLNYPHDRGTSIRINSYALPILRSEAIKAQNANVNTVSGATDSSGAFRQSLAEALAQAKA